MRWQSSGWRSLVWGVMLLLSGCGGGGGSGDTTTAGVNVVSGTVTKGTVLSGTVAVYDGQGRLLGRDETLEPGGRYRVPVGDYTGPVVVRATVLRYEDEITGRPVQVDNVALAAVDRVTAGVREVHVTPVTQLAFETARQPDGTIRPEDFERAQQALNRVLGIQAAIPLTRLQPRLLRAGTSDADNTPATRYGAILAAVAADAGLLATAPASENARRLKVTLVRLRTAVEQGAVNRLKQLVEQRLQAHGIFLKGIGTRLIPASLSSGGTDADGDGVPDAYDPRDDRPVRQHPDADYDGDGVPNRDDAFPYDRDWRHDRDRDGLPDLLDEDDDNDGVPDTADSDAGQPDTRPYPYIPTPDQLTDEVIVRFLNRATFGANAALIAEVREKGIVHWLETQLAMPLERDRYLRRMIEIAKQAEPGNYPETVADYLADNDVVFNRKVASFKSWRYRLGSWLDAALRAPDQVRHKTAYALSQIIVESDFEPLFQRRAEALARYFDILAHNALGNYRQLLLDISFSSGMGVFLTYNGSRKAYTSGTTVVYPDENYARELMQLFTIGLHQLNPDGTPKRDAGGELIPTYTQTDVNELARVFTGWDLKRNRRYGQASFSQGDLTHPMEFTPEHHDFGVKTVLGQTIPAGLSGEDDIRAAIDILMAHENMAPFIARKLIMRLAKSNPSPAYVQRVAQVFNDNGNGVKGDLKAVVRAILLDEELWTDLKNGTPNRFKEPVIAMTQMFRALHVRPLPVWYLCRSGSPPDGDCSPVRDAFYMEDPRRFLGQGPGLAPNVFNFYDDGYIPNDTVFKQNGWVAPETQIQSDAMLVHFSNEILTFLTRYEKNWILASYRYRDADGNRQRYDSLETLLQNAGTVRYAIAYRHWWHKLLLDLTEELNVVAVAAGGQAGDLSGWHENLTEAERTRIVTALVDHLDRKLTGGMLTAAQKTVMINRLSQETYNPRKSRTLEVLNELVVPAIRAIVTSDVYMVE